MPADSEPLAILVAGTFGLFIGSFLNVVAHRVPRRRSVVRPRSSCPRCGHSLSWWENLPLLSWVLLRGRCHECREPISVRYPVVELLTGLTFGWIAWASHGRGDTIAFCILAATMVAVVLIELDGSRTPLAVPAVGTALALCAFATNDGREGEWHSLIGPLCGFACGLVLTVLLRLRSSGADGTRVFDSGPLVVAGTWLGALPAASVIAAGCTLVVAGILVFLTSWVHPVPRIRAAQGGTTLSMGGARNPALASFVIAAAMVVALSLQA